MASRSGTARPGALGFTQSMPIGGVETDSWPTIASDAPSDALGGGTHVATQPMLVGDEVSVAPVSARPATATGISIEPEVVFAEIRGFAKEILRTQGQPDLAPARVAILSDIGAGVEYLIERLKVQWDVHRRIHETLNPTPFDPSREDLQEFLSQHGCRVKDHGIETDLPSSDGLDLAVFRDNERASVQGYLERLRVAAQRWIIEDDFEDHTHRRQWRDGMEICFPGFFKWYKDTNALPRTHLDYAKSFIDFISLAMAEAESQLKAELQRKIADWPVDERRYNSLSHEEQATAVNNLRDTVKWLFEQLKTRAEVAPAAAAEAQG